MAGFELEGKVAIVTGASKGIGEAIAKGFSRVGARVVVSSRKQEILVHAITGETAAGLSDGEMDRRVCWLEGERA